jgi:hypothetical protein
MTKNLVRRQTCWNHLMFFIALFCGLLPKPLNHRKKSSLVMIKKLQYIRTKEASKLHGSSSRFGGSRPDFSAIIDQKYRSGENTFLPGPGKIFSVIKYCKYWQRTSLGGDTKLGSPDQFWTIFHASDDRPQALTEFSTVAGSYVDVLNSCKCSVPIVLCKSARLPPRKPGLASGPRNVSLGTSIVERR